MKKTRTRDPASKHRAILDAALKEMARNGYAGARSEKIAAAAGVSVGTVFKLFHDKRSLANAVYLDCLTKVRDQISPSLMSGLPARKAFDSMWAAYTELFVRDPDCLSFFEYQLSSDYLDNTGRVGRQLLREGLLKWIEYHQSTGEIKKVSTELLRAIAIGSIMRLVRESLDGNHAATQAEFLELREAVWDAIAEREKPVRKKVVSKKKR